MIADGRGRIVWFKPVDINGDYGMNFKVQFYKNEPVLTYWEGSVEGGNGAGDYRILDNSYDEIARIEADGFDGDHHEFLITPQNTALITIYNEVRADLTWAGGEAGDTIIEGVIQEIDIETGQLIFEWHSLDHVGLEESYAKFTPGTTNAYDYFRINSVDLDNDGNLLVSAQETHTVYKIDRETGEVIWRLGGKNSDFEMEPNARFVRQHDARSRANGTISLLDNGQPRTYKQSYGKVLALDTNSMTARLTRAYTHPAEIYADNQGNVQFLPNGNVFIGWGSEPYFSEFSDDGRLLFHGSLPPEAESYRAFRFPWAGSPVSRPAVSSEGSEGGSGDTATLYVSWNGATGISAWRILTGPDPESLESAGEVPWQGFETAIELQNPRAYVSIEALDPDGGVLEASEPVEL